MFFCSTLGILNSVTSQLQLTNSLGMSNDSMGTFTPSNAGTLDLGQIDFGQVAKKLSGWTEDNREARDKEGVQFMILCGFRHYISVVTMHLCSVPDIKELLWFCFKYLLAVINLIRQQMGDSSIFPCG